MSSSHRVSQHDVMLIKLHETFLIIIWLRLKFFSENFYGEDNIQNKMLEC